MISQETRSMRIFGMLTMGFLLVGISMLSAPAIGHWALVLLGFAILLLLRAILLAITLDRPSRSLEAMPDNPARLR
ncbi:hypothetical protein OCH239_14390 [Roseivivax halodurans JCM 10272]|uniref:Uncharacterized protein n=1 Tax=Roseivivax halodurans JCM 10272 TaxID=1449350 RepID=X7EID9_9RHOB|nr:hypothetical protein [Roseivivax halodurans]ETX15697.1 hypothetical protein OCH239_14390 [Roseivivax halodurans JCM 10272]